MFTNPDGRALNADQLTVDGGMFLDKAQCTGEVGLVRVHLGYLSCGEAVFSNADGMALGADGLTADGGMSLGKAQCAGEVGLIGAHLGQLEAAVRRCSPTPTGWP